MRNSLEVCLAQTGFMPKVAPKHRMGERQKPPNPDGTPGGTYMACMDCGATRLSGGCNKREMHRNLLQVADQTYSSFCLHLGAAWGFHVDQSKVDKIEAYALRRREKLIDPFVAAGIVTRDDAGVYHEDQSVLKRMVAVAYGATEPCPHCSGTGKVPSPAAKPVRCPDCKGYCLPTAKDGPKCREWREANSTHEGWRCLRCNNTALVPNPNPSMINCVVRGALVVGGDGKEREDDQKTCDGTGLALPPGVPRADKGGVAKGRDPLVNSGDEFLMTYGFFLEDQKTLSYVAELRQARACIACGKHGTEKHPHREDCSVLAAHTRVIAGEDGDEYVVNPIPSSYYRDIPWTLRPNNPLETERVSYRGLAQVFPRKPGFIDKVENGGTGEYIPSLRECIVARGPRYETVEVPDDYVLQPGELAC